MLQRRRHYWRLDTKAITLFNDDTTSRYYKEMVLSDIATVDALGGQRQGPDGRGPPVFTIALASMSTLYNQSMRASSTSSRAGVPKLCP